MNAPRLLLVLLVFLTGCKPKPQWAQRSVPGLGLSLHLPAEPRLARLDAKLADNVKIYLASTERAHYAACSVTFSATGKLDEDATLGAMMDLMGNHIVGAERHPFLLDGHLGAELVGSLPNGEASRGFALDEGGPIVLRMLALAEQHRGLLWYGVAARPEELTPFIESAQLE